MISWQKVKLFFGGAIAIALAFLGFRLQQKEKQLERERDDRIRAQAAHEAEQERRKDERAIEHAMQQTRNANGIYEAENRGRRTGNFGSAERLRDDA